MLIADGSRPPKFSLQAGTLAPFFIQHQLKERKMKHLLAALFLLVASTVIVGYGNYLALPHSGS